MNRRQVIKQISITGGAVVLTGGLFSSCHDESYEFSFFNIEQYETIESLSEFILPRTEVSPGATEAKVSQFMDTYISACLKESDQLQITAFIKELNLHTQEQFQKTFSQLTDLQKAQCLDHYEGLSPTDESTYRDVKSIILFSYFTSQEGVTKALRYLPVPQKFEGHIDYQKGDKAWALS